MNNINVIFYHCVKEEFGWSESRVETVFNETFCGRNFRMPFEVRKGSILETVRNAFTVQGLLAHARDHLRDVDERSLGPTQSHY